MVGPRVTFRLAPSKDRHPARRAPCLLGTDRPVTRCGRPGDRGTWIRVSRKLKCVERHWILAVSVSDTRPSVRPQVKPGRTASETNSICYGQDAFAGEGGRG